MSWRGRLGTLLLATALGGCDFPLGMLAPRGPVAAAERHLLLIVLLLMAIVVVPVLVLTPLFAWRYRLGNKASAYRPTWDFSWTLEGLVWGIPVVIVASLGVFLWRETHRLDPWRAIAAAGPALEVQAVGLDWKWLFIYPDQHIATVNQLAFPADRSVHLSITSDTVMQSLMIPQLGGQIFAMAGMTTQLNLKADAPGRFIGENMQFSGHGFQDQKFVAMALAPDDFAHWVAGVRASGATLDAARYAKVAEKSSVPAPLAFSSVEDGLFARIIDRYRPGMAQPAASHGAMP